MLQVKKTSVNLFLQSVWATTCPECRCLWRWFRPLADQDPQGKMEIQACRVPQGYQAALDRLAVKEGRDPWVHPVRGTNVLTFPTAIQC